MVINYLKNRLLQRQLDVELEAMLRQLALCWTLDREMAEELVSRLIAECNSSSYGNPHLFELWCCSCLLDLWETYGGQASGSLGDLDESLAVVSQLAMLSAEERVVLTLIDIAELSYRDIAYVMHVNEHDIRRLIRAARNRLLNNIGTRLTLN